MRLLKKLIWLTFSLNAGTAVTAESDSHFGQIQIELKTPRTFTHKSDSRENRIDIAIKDTLIEELSSLDYYDERFVKRIIVKQLPNDMAIVRIFLKNQNHSTLIKSQSDPFRILIDIFSPQFQTVKHDFSLIEELPKEAPPQSVSLSDDGFPNNEEKLEVIHESLASSDSNSSVGSNANLESQDWPQTKFYPPYIYKTKISDIEHLPNDLIDPSSDKAAAIDLVERAKKSCSENEFKKCKHFLDQAIRQDSNTFVENKGLLWNYAELNLLAGELELANGYYQVLRNTFPSSMEAQFAKLRGLDVRAINAQNQPERLLQLGDELSTLNLEAHTEELKAWYVIRQTYWSDTTKQDISGKLPVMSESSFTRAKEVDLSSLQKNTKFLLHSLMLAHLLGPEKPWHDSSGILANQYFTAFKSDGSPFVSTLKDGLQEKLSQHFKTLYETQSHQNIINSFEALPGPIQSIKKTAPVAWIVANAYMQNARNESAITTFRDVEDNDSEPDHQFYANFYAAFLGKKGVKAGSLRKNPYDKQSDLKDRKAESLWIASDHEQKLKWIRHAQSSLQEGVRQNLDIRTSALMMLHQMENLGAETSATAAQPEGSTTTAPRIVILSFLAKSFGRLGMGRQKQKALELLAKENPTESTDTVRQAWVLDMQSLSEDYRAAGDYLKSGETLRNAAQQSLDWEKKSESLYKSALLLLRAGRRNEAVTVLTDACSDDSNVYYKTLSCERLAQLENQ